MEQEPEEEKTGEAKRELIEFEDVEALKNALAEERARVESYLASWKRVQADFINYKRRVEQEREEMGKLANSALMLNLLPALDDLERALASIPRRWDKLAWVDGIRLIERKFRASLEGQGLAEVKAQGSSFDPNLHEAVTCEPGKKGIVIRELQKGYKLYDRVIRHSKVVVGSGEEKEKKEV